MRLVLRKYAVADVLITSLLLCIRIGQGFNIAVMPYGDWWRRHRRAFWQHFRPDAVEKYREYQHDGVRRLLSGLLATPDKLQEHVR